MCETTGKTNMTYEEAANSERKARRLMDEGLPDIWKKAVLSKANYGKWPSEASELELEVNRLGIY
jgi:hypothetical protein